jgi:hypothetical protein
MMTYRAPAAAAAVLSALLWGCGRNNFDEGRVVDIAGGRPFNLESEEVTLTNAQVGCGVENDLWDAPAEAPGRAVAHLTQKARDLNFTDDVSINEAGYSQPHAQMRGKVSLAANQVLSIADGKEQGTKIVQVQLQVVVPHPCFPAPLPIMGIRRSRYAQGLAPMVEFDYTSDGWRLAKILH